MLRAALLTLGLALAAPAGAAGLSLTSARAVVVDEATGEVLLDKNGADAAPIASLTKLMTAMVVLDARQPMDERIRITTADLDRLKHTRRGLRVGTVATRLALLELTLIASDNRAASALARHHRGGLAGFRAAVQRKIESLGLEHTVIEEPTGLSPGNRSTALDMARVMSAAAGYPEIAEITSRSRHVVKVNGRPRAVRNTNALVGTPGWDILLSKTGYTREAGRCLTMRLKAAGRTVMVVLMGAKGPAQRARDALSIRRWLADRATPAEPVGAPLQVLSRRLELGVHPVQ